MLKVDACLAVGTDNDLKLVVPEEVALISFVHRSRASPDIPSVRTGSHLNSSVQLIRATEQVSAELLRILRADIVEANDEER